MTVAEFEVIVVSDLPKQYIFADADAVYTFLAGSDITVKNYLGARPQHPMDTDRVKTTIEKLNEAYGKEVIKIENNMYFVKDTSIIQKCLIWQVRITDAVYIFIW